MSPTPAAHTPNKEWPLRAVLLDAAAQTPEAFDLPGLLGDAAREYADLYVALGPFAAKDECEIGTLVGSDDEHTANCSECQRILAARAALARVQL